MNLYHFPLILTVFNKTELDLWSPACRGVPPLGTTCCRPRFAGTPSQCPRSSPCIRLESPSVEARPCKFELGATNKCGCIRSARCDLPAVCTRATVRCRPETPIAAWRPETTSGKRRMLEKLCNENNPFWILSQQLEEECVKMHFSSENQRRGGAG